MGVGGFVRRRAALYLPTPTLPSPQGGGSAPSNRPLNRTLYRGRQRVIRAGDGTWRRDKPAKSVMSTPMPGRARRIAAAPAPRRQRDDSPPRQPRKKKRAGKQRSGFGKLIYWGAVLALWAVIAAIGLLVWIGAHLPPIQSLEIPKRPPSVLILGATARRSPPAATWAAPKFHCANCRITRRRRSSPSRTAASTPTTASIRGASCAPACATCCIAAQRKAARPSPSSSPRICS